MTAPSRSTVVAVALAALCAVMLLVWKPWEAVAHPGKWFSRWVASKVLSVEPDTVFSEGPVTYVDRWVDRVVYRTADPDTVLVTEYSSRPPTASLVSATATDDGWLTVEVLVDSSRTLSLRGRLAPSGDTHVVVGPDSSVHFASPRFGYDPALCARAGLFGLGLSAETLYWNDVPVLGTTVHAPCADFAVSWAAVRGDEPLDEGLGVGLSAAAEVSPFHTPARVSLGAVYDTGSESFHFEAGATVELVD